MAKISKKIISFWLSILALVFCIGGTVILNVYHYNIEEVFILDKDIYLSKYLFYAVILVSGCFSFIYGDVYVPMNLEFGITRNNSYKKYLKTIFSVLIFGLILVIINIVIIIITYGFKNNSLLEIKELKIGELISIYIFINMLSFYIGISNFKYFKKVYVYILLIVVGELCFVYNPFVNLYYLCYFLGAMGVGAIFINKFLMNKITINKL